MISRKISKDPAVTSNGFVRFTSHERPPEIFFCGHIAMDEEDSCSPKPFPVTAVDSERWHGYRFRRKNLPDVLHHQRVIKEVRHSTSNGSQRISAAFSTLFPRDISMEDLKIRESYEWSMNPDKCSVANKAPVSAFSRWVISEAFSIPTAKWTADSIGRTDKRFFIDTLLTDVR